MPKIVLIDEFHIALSVAKDIRDFESDAIRRTLSHFPFRSGLARAIRKTFRRYRSLSKVTVQVSR